MNSFVVYPPPIGKVRFIMNGDNFCLDNRATILGREVVFEKIFEPLKAGDVPATYASMDKLQEAVGFKPSTSIEEGLQRFADWYVEHYGVK